MSPAPRKRSTFLVIVGVGVFVVGTALAAFATRDGSESPRAAVSASTTTPPGLVVPPAGAPSFVIPAGKQAVTIAVPFVNGVGNFTKAGNHVNVFGVFKNFPANATLPNPAAKLVLSDVEVLAVTPGVSGGNSTYLLAVDANQAEEIVYLQSFEASYLTLARDGQGQLSTAGRTPKNAA